MIGFAAAFWFGMLPLVALPVLIHVLRKQPTTKMALATLRFLKEQPSRTWRWQWPDNIPQLLLRMAIIAVLISTLAQPFWKKGAVRLASIHLDYSDLTTEAFLKHWKAMIHEAVDTVYCTVTPYQHAALAKLPRPMTVVSTTVNSNGSEHVRNVPVQLLYSDFTPEEEAQMADVLVKKAAQAAGIQLDTSRMESAQFALHIQKGTPELVLLVDDEVPRIELFTPDSAPLVLQELVEAFRRLTQQLPDWSVAESVILLPNQAPYEAKIPLKNGGILLLLLLFIWERSLK